MTNESSYWPHKASKLRDAFCVILKLKLNCQKKIIDDKMCKVYCIQLNVQPVPCFQNRQIILLWFCSINDSKYVPSWECLYLLFLVTGMFIVYITLPLNIPEIMRDPHLTNGHHLLSISYQRSQEIKKWVFGRGHIDQDLNNTRKFIQRV